MDSYLQSIINEREEKEKKIEEKNQHDIRVKQWTTFYRRNPEIYAEERLRIKLRPFQRIMLHLMLTSQVFFAVCARGLAKTFTAGLAAVVYCLLYPYAEVVITASTVDQARKIVDTKIQNELIGKLSPVLHYMYDKGLIKLTATGDKAEVIFWNGSHISVLPPLDSSRGQRANFIIYEECRLLTRWAIDSIFEPMSIPRQPLYITRDEYSSDKDCIEEAKSIYITSSRYKNEWWYRMIKKVIMACYTNKSIPYNFFMADIYTAIKYGLKSEKEWLKIKENTSPLDIDMEYLNIAVGEAENSYFTLDEFKSCQINKRAFIPPNGQFIKNKIFENREKHKNETRLLVCDFAFSTTTKNAIAAENDNTVLMCISGQFNKNTFTRHVEHIETLNGGESEKAVLRIRELFYDYECDYIVMDGRSGGETIYNELTRPFEHPTRKNWDSRGLSVCRDVRLQNIAKTKLDDLINRTVDPNAIQCIVPIYASETSNDLMWRALSINLSNGSIKLLIDELVFEDTLDTGKYLHLTNDERARLKLPYIQTELLINEAINLRQNILKGGKIQLKEPNNGHKDRIVCLAYGNAFIDKLENLTQYEAERHEDFSESDWEGIFQ